MCNEWKCVLADAVKPVGMWHPLNVGFFTDIDDIAQIFARVKFIKYQSVVDSIDFCFFSIEKVKNLFAFFNKFRDANNLDAGEIAC